MSTPLSKKGPSSDGLGPDRRRRRDLDRLRVAACLTTFFYHAIQVYDLNPYYHIKSATPSPAIDIAAQLLHAVRMPLFFLLAGMAAAIAMARRSDAEFLKVRAVRLLPPVVLGVLVLTPWIKYLEVLDGRSIAWFGITELAGPPPDLLVVLRRYYTQFRWFSWSHLWFPVYLMLLSSALLPVLRRLPAGPGPRRPLLVALAALPVLIGVEIVLRPIFPWHIPNLFWDWASMTVYVTVFVLGAAIVRWTPLEAALQRALPLSLAAAVLGTTLYVGIGATWPVKGVGRALWLWGFLCLAIGLGPWIGRGRLPGEAYLAEGALPIYVIHHVPLVTIGYWVKDLPWPIWQRYGVMVAGAFVVTLAAYHLLVRPSEAMRAAFGMPLRRPARPPESKRDAA
ncbi:MAG: acyltransferase family protein [Hyphomicrobiaceae bacterium]|nr:acyltransferase family protein [Hyphomicrobiaceae bacterium]